MKFILVSPKNRTAYNFRGDLIKKIIEKGYEVIVTGPNLDGIDRIKELGAKFELIPLEKNGLNLINDFKYMQKLKRLFIKEKPDIILSYTIKPVIYSSISAKKANIRNINTMITGAGYLFTATTFKARFIKYFVKLLYKYSLRRADTVIFQNKDDLKAFVDNKLVHKDKVKLVNGSGINMEYFKPVEFPKQLTFFMLSRMLKSKGVLEYLEAARIVKAKYKNVRFMSLGAFENIQDSINYEKVKPYVDEGIIELYGETDDVREYYRQSSVYVLPSYREGTPRTVLEAMAMKRPIITTNAPGCDETVINGVTGIKVPIKDIDSIVEAMEFFIKNPDKIQVMGEESYKLCKEKYDVVKVNKKMFEYMSID